MRAFYARHETLIVGLLAALVTALGLFSDHIKAIILAGHGL